MPFDHIVAESETTSSLAAEYGFSPHTMRKHHAGPGRKRGQKKISSPGDFIKIPDKIPKETSRNLGSMRRFMLKNPPARFKLQIYFADGQLRCGSVFIELPNASDFYKSGV